jgi:hypothetical protein
MKLPEFNFVQTARVRRAVVSEGDIRGDIEFQNDINLLLARMEGSNPPLQALDLVREAVTPPSQPTGTGRGRSGRLAAMLGRRPATARRS